MAAPQGRSVQLARRPNGKPHLLSGVQNMDGKCGWGLGARLALLRLAHHYEPSKT